MLFNFVKQFMEFRVMKTRFQPLETWELAFLVLKGNTKTLLTFYVKACKIVNVSTPVLLAV